MCSTNALLTSSPELSNETHLNGDFNPQAKHKDEHTKQEEDNQQRYCQCIQEEESCPSGQQNGQLVKEVRLCVSGIIR